MPKTDDSEALRSSSQALSISVKTVDKSLTREGFRTSAKKCYYEDMKKFTLFLVAGLLFIPNVSFASILASTPSQWYPYQSQVTEPSGTSTSFQVNCSYVNGDVTGVKLNVSGYGSAPTVTNLRLKWNGVASTNATTTHTYPELPFTFTFSPSISCTSGTSTLSFSADSNFNRGFFQTSTTTVPWMYWGYVSTQVPVIQILGDAPTPPEATSIATSLGIAITTGSTTTQYDASQTIYNGLLLTLLTIALITYLIRNR